MTSTRTFLRFAVVIAALAGAGFAVVQAVGGPEQAPARYRTEAATQGSIEAAVLAAVRDAAPGRTPHDARVILARLLLKGDAPTRPVAALSGGERFRVALARVLFAEPAPQLLVLDEPTNNLDMASVDQLASALEDYRGALLVVTHDDHLARALRVDRTWVVERPGGGAAVVRDETLEAFAGRAGSGASTG